EALQAWQRRAAQAGENPDSLHDVLVALQRLGDYDAREGNLGSPLSAQRQALEIARPVLATMGDTAQSIADLARPLGRVGALLGEEDPDGALAAYEEARHAILRALDHTQVADLYVDLSTTMSRLAELHLRAGQLTEAKATSEYALAIDRGQLDGLGASRERL